jgi:GH15 family glucan-1,4-alpha-glucosidase
LRAIQQELGTDGNLLYRYSGVEKEENTFIACGFWLASSLAVLGHQKEAEENLQSLLEILGGGKNAGIMSEMYDVRTKKCYGNLPQGLSHLSVICAAHIITEG